MPSFLLEVNKSPFNDSDAAEVFLKNLENFNKLSTQQLGCSNCHALTQGGGEYPHLVSRFLTHGMIAFSCGVYNVADAQGWQTACNGSTLVEY